MDRKKLIKKLDAVFSLYIRIRDRACVTCGSTENLTCGHLFSRAHYSTRWDPRNAFAQCKGCNLRHEYDPGPLTSYFLSLYSAEDYDRLHKKFSSPSKINVEEMKHLVEVYQNLIKELEALP